MSRQYVELSDPDDGKKRWRIDRRFMESNWTCIWGRGCQGILDEPAEHLQHGCCSVGAEMHDLDEARLMSALAAMIDRRRFEYANEAQEGGVLEGGNTRVLDGACIFLNRPGFSGGAGCALHLAALDAGEPPSDWKPFVCWQLPIKIDYETSESPEAAIAETATVRPWTRADWGREGTSMAWLCTEEPEPYVGERRVADSLAFELTELLGAELYAELLAELDT